MTALVIGNRKTKEVEPKFRKVYRNGKYIDKKQEIKGFTR